MKIDKSLNLVFPIDREDGQVFVHSTPISHDVFRRYYDVLAKTLAWIYQNGVSAISGPKIAAMVLEDIAKSMDKWDGEAGVANGLMAELRRSSSIIMPAAKGGWFANPLQMAIDEKRLDPEEIEEVEGVIVFFICVSATLARAQRGPILAAAADLWGAHVSSSSFTEFLSSLRTPTAPATTGAKADAAALPPQPPAPPARTISASVGGKPAQLPH